MRNDKPRHFNSYRSHIGRSLGYDVWLREQPPERRRELVSAERAYMRQLSSPTGPVAATAAAYIESLKGPTYQHPTSQLLDPVPAA